MDATNEKQTEIRFGDLWGIFKRCWILALVVAVLAGAATFAVLKLTHEDEYTATTTIWALGSNASTSGGKTSTSDVSIGTYLINDYKELILTESVLSDALVRANSDMSLSTLKTSTKVTNNDDTRVMYLSVTASDRKEAMEIANAISEVFCERINDKSDEGKTLVSVWDFAKEPRHISNPISLVLVILVAIVGAVAVYAVYLIIRLMDDKINTTSDVERYLGFNILGVIPNREDARRRGLRRRAYYRYSGTKKY